MTLRLARETLAELAPADLAGVVGGTESRYFCLSGICLTDPCITWSEGTCATVRDLTTMIETAG